MDELKEITKLALRKIEKKEPVKKSWVKELYGELHSLKSQIKMRAYCDLIIQMFPDSQVDEIIGYLQDQSQQVRFEFHVYVTPKELK